MTRSMIVAAMALAFGGGAALAQNGSVPAPAPAPTTLAPTANGIARPGLAAMAGIQKACAADFASLCPGMRPGDGKLGLCIRQHQDKVSSGCRDALGALRGMRR